MVSARAGSSAGWRRSLTADGGIQRPRIPFIATAPRCAGPWCSCAWPCPSGSGDLGTCRSRRTPHHLTGEHDKGRAASFLVEAYREAYGPIRSIGVGDGRNELPLLQVVDPPVLVRREGGTFDEEVFLPNLLRADGIGPAGRNRAVLRLLET